MTSAIQKYVVELLQVLENDSGWALRSDEDIFNIILKIFGKSSDQPILLYGHP